MSQPPVSIVHINIHNMDFQANTVLSSSRGRVTQRNSMYHRSPVVSNASRCTPLNHSTSAISRRVEAQPRIRRTLEEVSTQPEYSSSRISFVASSATGILSVVEQGNVPFSTQLVDLAMDAHAVAYIVVVSFLYRRLRMSRKRVDKLIELLDTIHTLFVEAVDTGSIVSLLKKFATRSQRKIRVMRMHEKLLDLLRKIERNDNDVLSSLNNALDYHHQHSDADAAE